MTHVNMIMVILKIRQTPVSHLHLDIIFFLNLRTFFAAGLCLLPTMPFLLAPPFPRPLVLRAATTLRGISSVSEEEESGKVTGFLPRPLELTRPFNFDLLDAGSTGSNAALSSAWKHYPRYIY